jgi:hypothetical protein
METGQAQTGWRARGSDADSCTQQTTDYSGFDGGEKVSPTFA